MLSCCIKLDQLRNSSRMEPSRNHACILVLFFCQSRNSILLKLVNLNTLLVFKPTVRFLYFCKFTTIIGPLLDLDCYKQSTHSAFSALLIWSTLLCILASSMYLAGTISFV